MSLRTRRARASAVGAAALAALMVLGISSPAAALGSKSIACWHSTTVIGDSGQLYGGRTQPSTLGSSVCGSLGVQVRYQAYANSPVYTSVWKWGATGVKYHPGLTILGASHTVTTHDKPAGTFPFKT